VIRKRKQLRNTSHGHSSLIISTILSLSRKATKLQPKIRCNILKSTQASRISNIRDGGRFISYL